MSQADNAGQLLSASAFAALTGVSRERLRMWERRHGFPAPVRIAGGPRRYAVADVARVVAVRRAAEAGVPLPAAIERSAFATAPELSAATFRAAFELAPLPALVLSGPVPLRVEHANAALRATPAAPVAGADLASALPAFAASPALRALQDLFTGPVAWTALEHPAWTGLDGHVARAVAYRLPVAPHERPLVVLAGVEGQREGAGRAAAAVLQGEVAALRARDERHRRWLEGAGAVTLAFQLDPGPSVLREGVDVLVRHLQALDGAVARSVTGDLAVPGSRRGLLGPAMVTVAAHPTLGRHLRAATPLWLEPAAATAFGVPAGLHAACAPILVGGETLGALVLLFDEPTHIGTDERRLLTIVSAALGFGLLRDRLARELRTSAEGRGL